MQSPGRDGLATSEAGSLRSRVRFSFLDALEFRGVNFTEPLAALVDQPDHRAQEGNGGNQAFKDTVPVALFDETDRIQE